METQQEAVKEKHIAEEKINRIRAKIIQVLRIKDALDVRRKEYIQRLHSAQDEKSVLRAIESLKVNCSKERWVNRICRKGLAKALRILAEINHEVLGGEGFLKGVKSSFISQVPIIGKRQGNKGSIAIMFRLLYSDIKDFFVFLENNLESVEEKTKEQIALLELLERQVEGGEISGHVTSSKTFLEIEKVHDEELKIIHAAQRWMESRKKKVMATANRTYVVLNNARNTMSRKLNSVGPFNKISGFLKRNELVKRNKYLAAIQAPLVFPWGTPVTLVGIAFFGIGALPLLTVTTLSIKWSPTAIALLMAGGIATKRAWKSWRGPSQQAPAFAYAR